MTNELRLIIGDDGVLEEYNDEFDITIEDETVEKAKTIGDIVDIITDLIG